MKNNFKLKIPVTALVFLFVLGADNVWAETLAKNVIEMGNKTHGIQGESPETFTAECRKCHMEYIVTFPHKKHIEEYKIGCGDCHHDEKGTPMTHLEIGDDVKKCIACHPKPGLQPEEKGISKLTRQEKLAYHAEAMHENCMGCHNKSYDKEEGLNVKNQGGMPENCTQCHPNKSH